jgi:hypothetical protein
VEKYLRDSIATPERKAMYEEFKNKNLIPKLMRLAMEKQDSSKRARDRESIEKMNREEADSVANEESIMPERYPPPPAPKPAVPKTKIITSGILISDEKKYKKPVARV